MRCKNCSLTQPPRCVRHHTGFPTINATLRARPFPGWASCRNQAGTHLVQVEAVDARLRQQRQRGCLHGVGPRLVPQPLHIGLREPGELQGGGRRGGRSWWAHGSEVEERQGWRNSRRQQAEVTALLLPTGRPNRPSSKLPAGWVHPIRTRPVVKMPKLASVATIEALAVREVPVSRPRMTGPAAIAHAQLNSDSFCGAGPRRAGKDSVWCMWMDFKKAAAEGFHSPSLSATTDKCHRTFTRPTAVPKGATYS